MRRTKKCNHCGKNINVKYTVCPLCGGHIPDMVKPLSPKCPRCNASLKVYAGKGDKYEICPECGGMWLDKVKFHLATRKYDVFKRDDYKSEYRKGTFKDSGGYIPCVRCGRLMNRKNFGRISGVIIDKCGRHGVWLDGGELEKIRHFIADGGLERSRDREIEKNRAKLRELATTVGDVAFTQRLIHFWNPKRWLFRGF